MARIILQSQSAFINRITGCLPFQIKKLDFLKKYDRARANSSSWEVLMAKIGVLLLLIFVLAGSSGLGQDTAAGKKLIPVRPTYQEASYLPPGGSSAPAASASTYPTPKDQLYVFWILGRILSYPVDKTEAYLQSLLEKPRVKAAAPTVTETRDPFVRLDVRQIPPAPPALGGLSAEEP
jgi:hypothetical protein